MKKQEHYTKWVVCEHFLDLILQSYVQNGITGPRNPITNLFSSRFFFISSFSSSVFSMKSWNRTSPLSTPSCIFMSWKVRSQYQYSDITSCFHHISLGASVTTVTMYIGIYYCGGSSLTFAAVDWGNSQDILEFLTKTDTNNISKTCRLH